MRVKGGSDASTDSKKWVGCEYRKSGRLSDAWAILAIAFRDGKQFYETLSVSRIGAISKSGRLSDTWQALESDLQPDIKNYQAAE